MGTGRQSPPTSALVFDNDDISFLIARAALDAQALRTWSATRPSPSRSALRLVHAASRRQIDMLCEAYELSLIHI